MNRSFTNAIRFVMDECFPPIIRDSRWFMWPFYLLAYGRKDARFAMNFKRAFYTMSEGEIAHFYQNLTSLSRKRKTDLNAPSVATILKEIPAQTDTLLDAGCSSGFLLGEIHCTHPAIKLFGIDYRPSSSFAELVDGSITNLPYPDLCFDVVTCTHTLEHVLELSTAIRELKRVARKRLIVVVPRQRYFFHTLDEHIHFFMNPYQLAHLFQVPINRIRNIQGDWLIIWDRG